MHEIGTYDSYKMNEEWSGAIYPMKAYCYNGEDYVLFQIFKWYKEEGGEEIYFWEMDDSYTMPPSLGVYTDYIDPTNGTHYTLGSTPKTVKFLPVIKLKSSLEVVKASTTDATFGEYYELIVK